MKWGEIEEKYPMAVVAVVAVLTMMAIAVAGRVYGEMTSRLQLYVESGNEDPYITVVKTAVVTDRSLLMADTARGIHRWRMGVRHELGGKSFEGGVYPFDEKTRVGDTVLIVMPNVFNPADFYLLKEFPTPREKQLLDRPQAWSRWQKAVAAGL